MNDSAEAAREHRFEELDRSAEGRHRELTLDDLQDVRLPVTAVLGRATMLVRDVLELKEGAVVPLDKLAGELTDIYVHDKFLARGEVVVIGDVLHVRVGDVLGDTGMGDAESDDT